MCKTLSKRPKIGFQDQLSLNAGQKYCRMLPLEHSAILSNFIKLPFAIKIFIFEWLFSHRFYCTVIKNLFLPCKTFFSSWLVLLLSETGAWAGTICLLASSFSCAWLASNCFWIWSIALDFGVIKPSWLWFTFVLTDFICCNKLLSNISSLLLTASSNLACRLINGLKIKKVMSFCLT